jgi:hypothetical protein
MELLYFFTYIGFSIFFFYVFESFYRFTKARILFVLGLCWPVSLVVFAINEAIDYLTENPRD